LFGAHSQEIIVPRNPKHSLFCVFIFRIIRESTHLLGALSPMIRIVDEGGGHPLRFPELLPIVLVVIPGFFFRLIGMIETTLFGIPSSGNPEPYLSIRRLKEPYL
jgi:hypothetical protein